MNILKKIIDENRSLLSDKQIEKYISNGLLIKTENGQPNTAGIQPNSYDLSLSTHVSKLKPNSTLPTGENCIDPRKPMIHNNYEVSSNSKIVVAPGEFLLLSTRETLVIPNGIVGFVCGRSSIARLGIQTEQAGLIDAGFTGTITLEVCNQTQFPIVLYPHSRVAQVYFFKAPHAKMPYGSEGKHSKYNNQSGAVGSRVHLDIV